MYWAACRVVDFNEVGGSLIGVNAAQTDFGDEGGEVGALIDDDDDQVQDADEWLRRFWRRTRAEQIRWFDRLPSGHKRLYSDYSPQPRDVGQATRLHRVVRRAVGQVATTVQPPESTAAQMFGRQDTSHSPLNVSGREPTICCGALQLVPFQVDSE